ncbi:brefeldin A-inhibited guanine nucleotide-exchange protein 3-like [Saccostrea echinata]|uniref:brefeldin A-inhibited guanine nucleotide-exchange protein 3-like n=1 Tax=Saccostrea echinata TaxID=191078 RepID=UPI002A7F59B6|nr:brefeldin A-inhibited guanine nucleotide-exchange protein 3-like [Saccostrea echinata]
MEDILSRIIRDSSSVKYTNIKSRASDARELLQNKGLLEVTPAHVLREKCLEPLQLALESKNKKLATEAIDGIQVIFGDDRFQSSIECEGEERWMPIQILNTVLCTPSLPEDTQMDIMKLLLNMTFSTSWCMNAKVITKITQVYIDTYMTSTHNVRGTVKAALTQLLTSFTDKLQSADSRGQGDDGDVLADFNPRGNTDKDGLTTDTINILQFFTNKLEEALGSQTRVSVPLLLEGVLTILSNCPREINSNELFQEIIWKSLCPCLISLLGSPKSEKTVFSQKTPHKEDIGRGSGCSMSAPNLQATTAKTVYSIAVSLVELMGTIGTMRPVLESLFHRMLLYSPPQHRLDALKAVRELLKTPENLYNLAAPAIEPVHREKGAKNPNADISLLKLIVDSLEECCNCNDLAVCVTSVTCVEEMLGALELTCKGEGITPNLQRSMAKFYRTLSETSVSCHSSVSSCCQETDGETDIQEIDVFQKNNLEKKESQGIIKGDHSNTEYRIREEIKKQYNRLGRNMEELEKQNAQEFVRKLEMFVPRLEQMLEVTEVDEALQQFAAEFCTALYDTQSQSESESHMAILNADGVYVASVSSLHLCLQLSTSGYYNRTGCSSITEKDFVDSVLGCGLLLFLSPAWLREVYHQLTRRNLLQNVSTTSTSPLINFLKDIDGLGNHEKGGQFLSSFSSVQTEDEIDNKDSLIKSGRMFARHVLSKCWDSILDVLSVLLNGKSSCGISSSLGLLLGTEGAKEESLRAREAICTSLNGLQRAAKLCCALGLQEYCGAVFCQLASTSCVTLDTQRSPVLERKSLNKPTSHKPKLVKLHASHVLSMDVVMTTGLEMGSHSADCWKHLFRCCAFISELEHTYFSMGNNHSNLPKLQQETAVDSENQENINYIDEPELYSMSTTAAVPVAPRINITELIRQSGIESGWERSITGGGVLNAAQSSKALCGLSQEVDRLFEEAANQLNLQALLDFLSELCDSSQHQLFSLTQQVPWEGGSRESQLPPNSLHLYRLQEVLMKVVHSDRPLLHLMRTWSVVSPHLVESAGHKDRIVSKMAVTCVHDFILAMLSDRPELAYFHVNELLCKPFENMLCLEVCDGDVQDQIVCSICELVEACTADIKSGWRPLFGALRAVKIEYTTNEEVNDARQRHVAAVLDVFEVYLSTDNVLVFANATVDCILCLLKYIRGPGEFDNSSGEDSDSGSDFVMGESGGENLCIPALGYLKRCSQILQTMWKMPACPVFNCAKRIQTTPTHMFVDSSLPHMNMGDFIQHYDEVSQQRCQSCVAELSQSTVGQREDPALKPEPPDNIPHLDEGGTDSLNSVDSGVITLQSDIKSNNKTDNEEEDTQQCPPNEGGHPGDSAGHCERCAALRLLQRQPGGASDNPASSFGSLDAIDNSTGILHVLFLLLEGLASAVSSCPKSYQPETLEMLFELLKATADVPGAEFALFCVNSLLLPMIQSWLREGSRKLGYWDWGANNFKQCCGLCTDLVVELVHKFSGTSTRVSQSVELMLKQLYNILVECISQPAEVISRLGCSCIRHVMLSAGRSFNEEMWQISGVAMETALDVSTFHLRQLMLLFHVDSDNFYGDIAQVKVAMRRDSSPQECYRLRHLAHQVFLLDSQMAVHQLTVDVEEDKSFVFLLYKSGEDNSLNPDDILLRLPFRNVVVGLLANQLLLQTIGSVLLSADSATSKTRMSGMIPLLSVRNIVKMLECLRNSYKLAIEFDSRPGLKFLIQKVARTEVAVNLYKQAGASMVFFIHTLLQIGANLPNFNKVKVKHLSHSVHQSLLDVCYRDTKHCLSTVDVFSSPELFIQLLKAICDELCQTYVDILSDETSSRVDTMAEQQVFFLIAQPDDISDIMSKRKKGHTEILKSKPTANDLMSSAVPLQEQACLSSGGSSEDEQEVESSDSDHPTKSKRELREEQDSKVYTIATDTLIKSLMTEYKRRKQANAMPKFVKISKTKKELKERKSKEPVDKVDKQIEAQRKTSYMKDSEARIQSWTELLCTVLGLFHQLPDSEFQVLLPTVFNCVNQLVCHATEQRLRDSVGQIIYRLGNILDLTNDSEGYSNVKSANHKKDNIDFSAANDSQNNK